MKFAKFHNNISTFVKGIEVFIGNIFLIFSVHLGQKYTLIILTMFEKLYQYLSILYIQNKLLKNREKKY